MQNLLKKFAFDRHFYYLCSVFFMVLDLRLEE